MFDHDVLDDAVRIDLVLVGDCVAQQFIQARRLESERLKIKGRTAVLPSSIFEGLDRVVFRCPDGGMKALPRVAVTRSTGPTNDPQRRQLQGQSPCARSMTGAALRAAEQRHHWLHRDHDRRERFPPADSCRVH